MTDTKKRITITLTDRPPVRISDDDWGLIAIAKWHSGEHECQANEVAAIRVRQHDDGRTIVYATRGSGPGGMRIGYIGASGGELLDAGADIPAAISRVAESCRLPEHMAQACIADLPAEDL